jgi:hypothetical protein
LPSKKKKKQLIITHVNCQFKEGVYCVQLTKPGNGVFLTTDRYKRTLSRKTSNPCCWQKKKKNCERQHVQPTARDLAKTNAYLQPVVLAHLSETNQQIFVSKKKK